VSGVPIARLLRRTNLLEVNGCRAKWRSLIRSGAPAGFQSAASRRSGAAASETPRSRSPLRRATTVRAGASSARLTGGGQTMTIEAVEEHPVAEELHRHPFLAGLAPEHLEELAGIARAAQFAGDEVILEQGEESTQLYLITSGRVALEISEAPRPFRVDTLGAGEEFGWSWALGTPAVYRVRALEPTAALIVPASELAQLCEADAAFGYALMRRLLGVVAERLQSTRATLTDTYLPAARRAGA
jgi:CRP-like cAMP-binding protein